jgi:exosome complex RNA-binding protein Rrp4
MSRMASRNSLICIKVTKIILHYTDITFSREIMMDFEQAKKVLQLTDARIRKVGSVDRSMSYEIHKAIFKFQPFERLVIAHHSQEVLTRLKEQTGPIANSLEQLIATAINLNYAEFGEFAHPSTDKLT